MVAFSWSLDQVSLRSCFGSLRLCGLTLVIYSWPSSFSIDRDWHEGVDPFWFCTVHSIVNESWTFTRDELLCRGQ